ncbi:MAG: hypothetical protein ACT6QZ_08540, partial [Methylophilus sp.]
ALSFGYLSFGQAKESNSPRGEIKCRNRAQSYPKNYLITTSSKCITRSGSSAICGKQSRELAEWRKTTVKQSEKPSKEIPIRTI